MRDPGAGRREAAALANRYERRADGSLRLGPMLGDDGQPVPDAASLSACRVDGSKPDAAIVCAVLIDWVLHIAVGVVTWLVLRPFGPGTAILSGLLAWIVVSFVHRTIVQRLAGATLGYALFGLRLRHPDGSLPTLGRLVRRWLGTLLQSVAALLTP